MEKSNSKINSERIYTERFEMLMKLIRISRMLNSAKIIPAAPNTSLK